ncbi:MAG TPA: hypothetical protein DD435_02380 [Cyanobacteria bacterium UBA8530]|nr:hypothetical protein [Cyanobacteria bacterium UBA8530]
MELRIEGDRFLLDGAQNLVFGGEFQYFRIPPALWKPGILTLQKAGVNLLSSYVPWICHEPEEGRFDFQELDSFLALCRSLGMPLLLKPGPYIYAEYQGFGIPHWLRSLHPELRMLVRGEADYPEIALNHPGFIHLVRRWFLHLWPHLRDCESLVAIQLDNETGLPQYGSGPFLYDSNPDTLERFQVFLEKKYQSIARLNEKWDSDYPSFEVVRYPDGPVPVPLLSDSFLFSEDYLAAYLSKLRDIWRELGYEGFLFSNELAMPAWPNHLEKKSRVVPLAYDLYPKFIRVKTTLDQPFSISFVPKLFAAHKPFGPLFCAEMGCGWLDRGVDVSKIATLQKILASYLHGAQGTILYPIQDGLDFGEAYSFGAALDQKGEPSERMEVVEAVGRFCEEWGPLLASSESLESPVGILTQCEGMHDVLPFAADPLDTATRCLDELLDRSVVLFSANAGLFGVLSEAGYTPRVLDLGRASPSELKACQVLFFNSSGSLSAEGHQKLRKFVEEGGILFFLGIPLDDPHLLPGRIKRRWRPRAAAATTFYLGEWLFFRLLERSKISHPLVRFTVDKLQPIVGVLKHLARAGVWLNSTLTGERVWTSRFVTYFELPPGAKPLLSFCEAPAAYVVPRGEGQVYCFGTLLGPHLNSPGYYLDDPEKRKSLSDFISALLSREKVFPLAFPIPGVEAVFRRRGETGILGLINRGTGRNFLIEPPVGFPRGEVSKKFSFLGSWVEMKDGCLKGRIEGGDVLILELLPSITDSPPSRN